MQLPISWHAITSLEDLNTIWWLSREKPVAIFKHSTRCGTSHHALTRLTANWNIAKDKLEVFYLDLLNHRDISDAIAQKTGIQHQSPQLIVLKQLDVIHSASHLAIKYDTLSSLAGA